MIHHILSFKVLFPVSCLGFVCLALFIYTDTKSAKTEKLAGAFVKTLQDTPEITTFIRLEKIPPPAFAMRAHLPKSNSLVGMAFWCSQTSLSGLSITTFFGGFPHDRRPVQLSVRAAENKIHRFGPVVAGGKESGFHSPILEDPIDVDPFLLVALRPDSLISNGYRSFWNRATLADNQQARDALRVCTQRQPANKQS